jgi:hypothetical protein
VGTEAFWVPAVLAATSAGASYVNTTNANNRQQSAEAQAINNQQAIRNKGNAEVNQTVQQIAKSNPQQIAAQETGNYVAQLRRNAAGSTAPGAGTSANPSLFGASTSALAPGVTGSSKYKADAANAQQQVQQYGNTEASEMGDLDAAVRQRQNEGLDVQTLNTNLNTLGAQSQSQSFVDQLRAQTAGQANPYVSLFSGLTGNAATMASKNPQWFAGTPSMASAAGSSNPYGYNGIS